MMPRDTEPVVKRGDRKEYLVAAMFQGQSYLVRRGVPLTYGPNGQDATDLDVLGIRFTPPFQAHRIICDCKDRTRSRPYERVFWAKGLSSFVKAAETYVALPKSNLEITNFAKSGGVRILTQSVIQDSLEKIYGSDDYGYGLAKSSFSETFLRRLATPLKKNKNASRILFQTRAAYLVEDPYVSMNVCMANLADATKALKNAAPGDQTEVWRFVAAEIVVLTSLLLLYIAGDTVVLNKDERLRYITQKLTYGDISISKAEEIFRLTQELAREATLSVSRDKSLPSMLPFDLGTIDPPSYSTDVVGLVERAINSPSLYYELPQLIDFLLFEQALQNRAFADEEYRKRFPSSAPDERLKIARNIFLFLKEAVGLDPKVFWPANGGNLPRAGEAS